MRQRYTSLRATFVRNRWNESSGEGREGGVGEEKAKESEELEEQNCLYIQDGDYRARFNQLACPSGGGEVEGPAGGISRANQVVCVSESE